MDRCVVVGYSMALVFYLAACKSLSMIVNFFLAEIQSYCLFKKIGLIVSFE